MRALLLPALLAASLSAPASAEEINLESADCNAHGVALYPPPSSVIPTNARMTRMLPTASAAPESRHPGWRRCAR